MNKQNMEVLTNIIGAAESGGQVYGKRRYDAYAAPYTNSNVEHTITLGWAQNYGAEAKKLIQMIHDKDEANFIRLDTADIISMLPEDWVAIKWNPTKTQKAVLIAMIDSKAGHVCQDELFAQLMNTFIAECQKLYTKDTYAIMMYCEIRHLGGAGAVKRIFDRLNGDYGLDAIMASLVRDQGDASNNNQVGDAKFWSRHLKCKEFIERYAIQESGDAKEGAKVSTEREIQKVVAVAQTETGYLEKATSEAQYLDSKTANAGYNNYTKYWRDTRKNGRLAYFGYPASSTFVGGPDWPYCACGLEWAFTQALGLERAKELLLHKDFAFINCETMYQKAKNAKQLISSPQRGCIVLFHKGAGTTHYHTELCYDVKDGIMYTIGWNTSGASSVIANGGGVCAKRYTISSTKADYFMPKYADGEAQYIPANTGTVDTGIAVTCLKKGSSGDAVKDIQTKLIALGYTCGSAGADGDFGPDTLNAVLNFQRYNGCEVDGIVGEETAGAINVAYQVLTARKTLDPAQATRLFVGKVLHDGVDVRSWAGREYGNINAWPKLDKGNLVDVLDYTQKANDGELWYFVRIADKWHGFVQTKNIGRT